MKFTAIIHYASKSLSFSQKGMFGRNFLDKEEVRRFHKALWLILPEVHEVPRSA